ncbi:LOW QUALITY PROTEIN: PTS system EIIBC component SAR0193, partial [Frankliniella fusca]
GVIGFAIAQPKKYHCGWGGCSSNFNTERLLRFHILRVHRVKVSQLQPSQKQPKANDRGKYVCSVTLLFEEYDSYTPFLSHLYIHLNARTAVKCPHLICMKVYVNHKSMSSHLSRYHSKKSESNEVVQISRSATATTKLIALVKRVSVRSDRIYPSQLRASIDNEAVSCCKHMLGILSLEKAGTIVSQDKYAEKKNPASKDLDGNHDRSCTNDSLLPVHASGAVHPVLRGQPQSRDSPGLARRPVTPVATFSIGEDFFPEDEESIFTESVIDDPQDTSDAILSNLAQFCMKIEYHHIVSEKVVQYTMNEMHYVHSHGLSFLEQQLKKNMALEDIPEEKIQQIISYSFKNDHFTKHFNTDLWSEHMRKAFYKRTFPFVKQERIDFKKTVKTKTGQEKIVNRFLYYISILETVKARFLDKSLNLKLTVIREDGILQDVVDGIIFQTNVLYKDNPLSLRIILYQDGVEIVNPLGHAKKKHKVIAVYLSILNLPEHVRSQIHATKLVALCKKKDFVHSVLYGGIVDDLKLLETEGVIVPGYGRVKAGLVCIAGDNLGSHNLGGFGENFSSSNYFCRFCMVYRPTFKLPHGECLSFTLRDVQSYTEAAEKGQHLKDGYKGVKCNSVFNELQSFHVCKPGLPRCIGHELMEGVIAADSKLFIDYYIADSWFTIHELNEAIDNFAYTAD